MTDIIPELLSIMKKKLTHNRLINGALGISLLTFIWLAIDITCQTGWSLRIDFKQASNFGTLVGGMFSFISVVLIVFTLKHQISSFERQSFSSKFFQQLNYHKQNVDEMVMRLPDVKGETPVKGAKVFMHIHRQIHKSIDEIRDFSSDGNYMKKNEKNAEMIALAASRKIDIMKWNLYNIGYLITFFGVDRDGEKVLKSILGLRYKEEFIKQILKKVKAKKTKYNSSIKYFGGHQHRLSHYFRNLFQTVRYANNFKGIDYDLRYEHVKTLRGQFSTYEQAVIFFNSISDIGLVWELKASDLNSELITKYNLIKNIPSEFITDVEVKSFYPDVEYEGEPNSLRKERKFRGYK